MDCKPPPQQVRIKSLFAGKSASNLALAKKTTLLPIKHPPTGSANDDTSSNGETTTFSDDDTMDAQDDPNMLASIGFGCPIIEEPMYKT